MTFPQFHLSELAGRIRLAIVEELSISSRGIPFRVNKIVKEGGILTLELEPPILFSFCRTSAT
jgi:hypothetical protein